MSKGTVGKSLKGYYTGQATSATDLKGLLASLAVQGLSLNNVTITTATIYGGSMDDVAIGDIEPSTGAFTEVTVGNREGTGGGSFVAYGTTVGDYVRWDPILSRLEVAGGLAIRDPTTLGNIQIVGNNITAVNPDGSINLIPNSSKGAVNVSGNLIQTAAGNVDFTKATNFTVVSTQGANITGNTGASLNSVTGGTAVTSVSGPTDISSDTGAVTVTAGTGRIAVTAGSSLIASAGTNIQLDAAKSAALVAHDGPLSLLSNTTVQFRVDVPITFLNDNSIIPPPNRGYQAPQIMATSTDRLVLTGSNVVLNGHITLDSPSPVVLPESGGFAFGVDDAHPAGHASIKQDAATEDLTISALRDLILAADRNVVLPTGVPLVFSTSTDGGGDQQIVKTSEGLVIQSQQPSKIILKGDVLIPAVSDLTIGNNVIANTSTGGLNIASPQEISIVGEKDVTIGSTQGNVSFNSAGSIKIPDDVTLQIGDVANVGLVGNQGHLTVKSVQDIILSPQSGAIVANAVSFALPDRSEISFGGTAAISTMGGSGDLCVQSDKANVLVQANQGGVTVTSARDLSVTAGGRVSTFVAQGVSIVTENKDVNIAATQGAISATSGTTTSLTAGGTISLTSQSQSVNITAVQGTIKAISKIVDTNGSQSATMRSDAGLVDINAATKVEITASTGKVLVSGGTGFTATAVTGNMNLISSQGSASIIATTGLNATTASGNAMLNASTGSVLINAGNGALVFTATNDVSMKTIAGNVALATGTGSVDLHTSAGDVSIDTSQGNVQLTAAAGRVGVNGANGVNLTADGGDLLTSATQGKIGVSALQDVKVTSTQGKVSVSASQDLSLASAQGNAVVSAAHGTAQITSQTVQITTTNTGGITLDAQLGDVQMTSEAGKVTAQGTNGFAASTTTGDIALTASQGNITNTASGAYTASVKGPLNLSSANAGLTLQAHQDALIASSRGGINIDTTAGNGTVAVKAGIGGVSIGAAGTGNVTVQAASGNVSMTSANGSVSLTATNGNALVSAGATSTATVQGKTVLLQASEAVTVPLGVPLGFGGNSSIYESSSDGKLHISDPEGVVFDRSVLINGDITVIGESSRIVSTTTTFHDGLVTLAPDAPVADKSDRGFEFLYHDGAGLTKWGMMGFSQQDYRFHLVLDGTNNRETYSVNQPGDLVLGSVYSSGLVSSPKVITANVTSGSLSSNLQIDGGTIALVPATKLTLPTNIPFQIGASSVKDVASGIAIDSKQVQVPQGVVQIGTTFLTTDSTSGKFSVSPSSNVAGISLNAAVTIPDTLNFGVSSSPSGGTVKLSDGKDLLVTAAGQFAATAIDNASITSQKAVTITSTTDTTTTAGGNMNITGQDSVSIVSGKVVQVTAYEGASTSTPGYYNVASGSVSVATAQGISIASQGNTTLTASGSTTVTSILDMSVKSTAGALNLIGTTAVGLSSNGAVSVTGATGVTISSPVKVAVSSYDISAAATHDTTVTSGNDLITTSARDTLITATRNLIILANTNASLTAANVATVQGTNGVTMTSTGLASLASETAVAVTSQGTLVMSAAQAASLSSQRQLTLHSDTDVSLTSNNDSNISATHNVNVTSTNNIALTAQKALTLQSTDSTTLQASGSITATSSNGDVELSGQTRATLSSPGNVSVISGSLFSATGNTVQATSNTTLNMTSGGDFTMNSGGNMTDKVAQNYTVASGGTSSLSSVGALTASSESSVSVAAKAGLSLTTTQSNVELRADNGQISLLSNTYLSQGKSLNWDPIGIISPSSGVLSIVNTTDAAAPVDVKIHGYISGDCTWQGNPIAPSKGGTGHLAPWLPTAIIFIDAGGNLTDRPNELCWNTSLQSMGIRTNTVSAEAAVTVGSGNIDLLGVNARIRYYDGVTRAQCWSTGVIAASSSTSAPSEPSLYSINTIAANGTATPTLIVNSQGQVGIGVNPESMRTLSNTEGLMQLSGDISFQLAVGTTSVRWGTGTCITGDVANGLLTLRAENRTVISSRLACPNGIQWDNAAVSPASATLCMTGNPATSSLLISAPSKINLTSPHVVHSARICFAHGVSDACTSYFETRVRTDGTGRDLAVVNDVGDILLAPKNSMSLIGGTSISFAGVGTIGPVASSSEASGSSPLLPLLAITSVIGTVLNPGTSGLVTIADGGGLAFLSKASSPSASASLGMDKDGNFSVMAATGAGIRLDSKTFISVPDNVPLNFGSGQPAAGRIMSDGDSLLIQSPDLITLSSNNVVVTGNFVVRKTSTFTIESETDFDSGVINLGGGQATQVVNISPGPISTQTLVTLNAAHHLVQGDAVRISDTIPNIDGNYSVASVPSPQSILVDYPFPGIPAGAIIQGAIRSSLTSNPNTDVGVVVNWHDSISAGTAGAKTGFFGFDRSTQRFTFIPVATRVGNTFTGLSGDIQVGSVYSSDVHSDGTVTATRLSVQDLISPLSTGGYLVSGSNFVIAGGSIDGTLIGAISPSQGAFTYLDIRDGLIIRNSNLVGNLNADLLDGKHAADFLLRNGSQALTDDWNSGPHVITSGGLAVTDLTETAVPYVGPAGRLVTDVGSIAMVNGVLSLGKLSGYTSTGSVNLDGNSIQNGTMYAVAISNARIGNSTLDTSNITISSGNTLDATAGTVLFADGQISGNVIAGGTAHTDITGTAELVRDGVYRRDFSGDNTILKADASGQPTALVVPEGTFLGRAIGADTSIQALTKDQAIVQLNAISRGLVGDNSMVKADVAGNPVSMEVPENTLVGRGATGTIHALSPQEAKDLLQVETITTAVIYREGALLRTGRSAEYPEGGTMTGLLLTSCERFQIATGNTPRSLDVNVETSYIMCDYLRTAGGRVALCKLGAGVADGHRKLIILSRLDEYAFLQVSCSLVTVGAPDPVGIIFFSAGQAAMLQWDAYLSRWFIIGGGGCQVVTPDDLAEPSFLDSLGRFSQSF